MSDSSNEAQADIMSVRLQPILIRATGEMLDARVIMEGHFRLSATEHSGHYINPQALFHQPDLSWRLAQDLIDILPPELAMEVDGVAGPSTGGAIIAHQVAGLLAARRSIKHGRVLYFEISKGMEEDKAKYYYVRPYYAQRMFGKRLLLVDDIISQGVTLGLCEQAIRRHHGTVLAAAAFAERGFPKRMPLPCPTFALWSGHKSERYKVEDCPMCKEGIPLTQF